MFRVCNHIAKDRLSQFGQLTFKDVTNIASLIDVTARYLKDNYRVLVEQSKSKESLALFQKCISLEGNPFTFFSQYQ